MDWFARDAGDLSYLLSTKGAERRLSDAADLVLWATILHPEKRIPRFV